MPAREMFLAYADKSSASTSRRLAQLARSATLSCRALASAAASAASAAKRRRRRAVAAAGGGTRRLLDALVLPGKHKVTYHKRLAPESWKLG